MICAFGLNILCWFNVNPTSQENNGVKWRSCFAQLLISTQHAPPFTHTANTSIWKVPIKKINATLFSRSPTTCCCRSTT